MWHGVRATYGFTKGRIYYEVKVEDELNVDHLEKEEMHPHVLRCGWSVDHVSTTLGEEPLSYGYGGTGKASTNLKFKVGFKVLLVYLPFKVYAYTIYIAKVRLKLSRFPHLCRVLFYIL